MIDLEKADRQLAILFPKLAGFQPTPLNLEMERQKLFNDRTYDPQLRYNTQKNFSSLKQNLKSIKTDSSVYGRLLKEKINEFLLKIEMMSCLGTQMFTKLSASLYSLPSRDLVSKAK